MNGSDEQSPQREEWRIMFSNKLEHEPIEFRIRLCADLDVNSEQTLYRWARGKNNPDSKKKVLGLARLIPELVPSLRKSFPQYFASAQDVNLHLVAPFLQRALEARMMVEEGMLLQTITHLALGEMVKQLDPNESIGVAAFLVLLHAEKGEKATSLMGQAWSAHGTGIWFEQHLQKSSKVGLESLAATAVLSTEPAFFPRDRNTLPTGIHNIDRIKSAASYPILASGHVGGAVTIVAAMPDFFDTTRRDLIKRFMLMVPLALRHNDFYTKDHIDFSGRAGYAEQHYLDALAREYPGDTHVQLKERAVARILNMEGAH